MSSAQVGQQRPSEGRRAALRQAEGEMGGGVPLVSNFFSIDRYYAAADKVFASFQKAYNEKRLDDAYVLGKRFAIFSLEALPSHDYFRSTRYANLRKANDKQVQRVIVQLEQVAKWMDQEELERQRLLQERRQRQAQERIRQQQEIERARYEELQQRIKQQRRKDVRNTTPGNVEQSALSKLQMLNSPSAAQPSPRRNGSDGSMSRQDSSSSRRTEEGNQRLSAHLSDMDLDRNNGSPSCLSHSGDIAVSGRTRRSRWPQQDNNELGAGDEALPPPMPPPIPPPMPPPPSYDQVVTKPSSHTNHLFPPGKQPAAQRTISAPAGGAIVGPITDVLSFPEPEQEVSTPLVPPPPYSFYDRDSKRIQAPKVAPARVPIRQLREKYNSDLASMKRAKKIEVFGLDTYQGRLRYSTNGCTVISPLVVSHHLKSPGSIADSTIVDVIDKQCPPLLRDIRSKLELEGDALIIPSDVHDYLVDHKILIQEKFAGACGGNILDEKHIGEFLRILEGGETGDHKEIKTGAALFFHEHVVSIVKVPIGRGKFCYDMIDSMPRLVDPKNGNRMMASRTRCHGLDTFAVLLRWYACGKFSESNCTYIDRNEWDETMADFDPRVFQAFVWTE